MEPVNTYTKKPLGINLDALQQLIERHAKIDACIENGQPIPYELRKNFVRFTIPNEPVQE